MELLLREKQELYHYTENNFAEVLIDAFIDLEHQTFTYEIPESLKKTVNLGTPVIVPFGENQIGGYVVNLLRENNLSSEIKIKKITAASSKQLLSPEFIELIRWISEYYHCSFLSVLKASIPSGILTKAQKEVILNVGEEEFSDYIEIQSKQDFRDFCKYILENKKLKASHLKAHFGRKYNQFIRKLQEHEMISLNFEFENRSKYRKQLCVIYLNSDCLLSKREEEVLNVISSLNGYETMQEVMKRAGTTQQLLKKLESKGCIGISEQIILRKPHDYQVDARHTDKFLLNEHQQMALDTFKKIQSEEKKNKVILLHGVTGSGKTEVYLQIIENVLNDGKNAIVLVPEISLTPQTVNRFRARFGNCIAVLHSGLSEGEKFDEWARIKHGLARIIIGARSAIFAPCEDIGVIIIDEEHEYSYKQENNPRYNAKTVALKRAELSNAPIILGSATPGIESYYHALNTKGWSLIELPERVESRPMPPVVLVDMRQEFLHGNRGIFSRKLKNAMEERLQKKEQSIIFINRRGYSTIVLCRDCGYCVKCRDCSVSMVYHSNQECLKCHYCGNTEGLPTKCPKCKSWNIKHFGIGTQKIETITQKWFPDARIARLDRDTTTAKDAHYKILNKFSQGEFDILIGTQMVAKGLDFPNVTLVGVIAADTALNIPDFRSGEKTFQLITQVAGRSGRGHLEGEVIVQAYSLEHVSIQASKLHDYKTFYHSEIEEREMLHYPPFSKLVNIIIANTSQFACKASAKQLGSFLKENKSENIISVLGPVPAAIPRIKTYYRYQVLLKTYSLEDVHELLFRFAREVRINEHTRLGIDIEPVNML